MSQKSSAVTKQLREYKTIKESTALAVVGIPGKPCHRESTIAAAIGYDGTDAVFGAEGAIAE